MNLKVKIVQILTTSKLICLIYNCIFYIINLLEIILYGKKKTKNYQFNKQKI